MIDKNLGRTLTAWFIDLNNTDHATKQYLYNEIFNHYVFDNNCFSRMLSQTELIKYIKAFF